MLIDWNIVHECDDENGEPTQWAAKVGKNKKIVYIEKTYQNKYGVSDTADVTVPYLVECKSYESARRWVTRYRARFEK